MPSRGGARFHEPQPDRSADPGAAVAGHARVGGSRGDRNRRPRVSLWAPAREERRAPLWRHARLRSPSWSIAASPSDDPARSIRSRAVFGLSDRKERPWILAL